MIELRDEEIYENFLQGDMQSLDIIYNRYKNDLLNFSKSIVRDLQVAEEIVQDIFTKILAKPEVYNNKYTLRSFLFLVCYRKSLTYISKTSRRNEIERSFLEVSESNYSEDVLDKVSKNEEKDSLLKALDLLKLDDKIVLELTEFQGFSIEEVAKILNKTEGATKILKFRAKKRLKRIMESKFSDTADNYKSRNSALKIILIIMCMSIITASAVYATIKIIKTVFKNPEYFNLEELKSEVEYKDIYIPEEIAREKMNEYLHVLLEYEIKDKLDLHTSAIEQDRVCWRYLDDNVEIRIDAITGKLIKIKQCNRYLKSYVEMEINEINISKVVKNLGLNIKGKVTLLNENNIRLKDEKEKRVIQYVLKDEQESIIIDAILDDNIITSITVEDNNFEKPDIVISYTEAINIVKNNYNVIDILKCDLVNAELRYQDDNNEAEKIKHSGEYRYSWNVVFIDEQSEKISIYIDCETGEIIEFKKKL